MTRSRWGPSQEGTALSRIPFFRALRGCLCLSALLACEPVTPVTGPGAPLDPDGRIAFVGISPDARLQIFLVRADGTQIVAATEDTADFNGPAWSPDGRRLAVATNIERRDDWDIYLVDLQTRQVRPIVHTAADERAPAWSADGTRIAFHSQAGPTDDWNIHVASVDGSQNRSVTAEFSGGKRYPAWSPDGARIAYQRERSLSQGIEVVNADGSGRARLTAPEDGIFDGAPVWSPDGSRIAFESNRHQGPVLDNAYREFEIYTMTAAGDSIARLTSFSAAGRGMRFPHWSADGSRIAFESQEQSQLFANAVQFRILTISPDGQGAAFLQLTQPGRFPRWSPM